MSSDIVGILTSEYRKLFDELPTPVWAVCSRKDANYINPSIPFVGRNYPSSRLKIAVYASAENLTNYEEGHGYPELLETAHSWNRHRAAFEQIKTGYFPYVHIQPVTDGGLLCAASFIRYLYTNEPSHGTPEDQLEEIVVANVGKYSLATHGNRKNVDYAGDMKYLAASLPYFMKDIEILRPDVLVLPNAMYKHFAVRNIADAFTRKVIAVFQCNARCINIHLIKYDQRAKALAEEMQISNPTLAEWTRNIKRISPDNFYRYYAHIESMMQKQSALHFHRLTPVL